MIQYWLWVYQYIGVGSLVIPKSLNIMILYHIVICLVAIHNAILKSYCTSLHPCTRTNMIIAIVMTSNPRLLVRTCMRRKYASSMIAVNYLVYSYIRDILRDTCICICVPLSKGHLL